MTEQKDTYTLVILGGMNPRIHHPSWYRSVGLFDGEEAEEAIRTPNTLITPPLAQIQTPKLTIVCQDDRWEIRTSDPNQVQRIQDITSKLFDDLLPHTPVAAAGFNFTYGRQTESHDVGKHLADVLVKSPLGLKPDSLVAGEVILRQACDGHTSMVNIRPALGCKHTVVISYNYEYRFETEGSFKLGDVITKRYKLDRNETEEQTTFIVEAFNRSAED